MFWGKKKTIADDEVLRLVAQNFYPFHEPTLTGLLKAIQSIDDVDAVKRAVMSIRAFHSVSSLYSALCIMECEETGLRTPQIDAKIEPLVRAGLKDFMKSAATVYDDVAILFDQRISEINALLQISGGKSRDEGNTLLVMFTLDRVFGRDEYQANSERLIPLGENLIKAILHLRIAFRLASSDRSNLGPPELTSSKNEQLRKPLPAQTSAFRHSSCRGDATAQPADVPSGPRWLGLTTSTIQTYVVSLWRSQRKRHQTRGAPWLVHLETVLSTRTAK